MLKLAISGKAGTGKDTLTSLLEKEFSCSQYFIKHMAFADPIKEIVLQMYPQLEREYLFGPSEYRNKIIDGSFKNGKPLTIRELLQDIGEDYKKYNSKIWINALNEKFIKIKDKVDMVIVSDLRSIDEFDYLKNNHYFLIRIKREDIKYMDHISETEQEKISDSQFNYVIYNNGPLIDLMNHVKLASNMVKLNGIC